MGAATVVSTVILMNISSWFDFLGDGITDVCGVHPRTIETGPCRQGRAVKALKTQKCQNVCWPPTSGREQIGDEGHICSMRPVAIEPDPGSTTLSRCVLSGPAHPWAIRGSVCHAKAKRAIDCRRLGAAGARRPVLPLDAGHDAVVQ